MISVGVVGPAAPDLFAWHILDTLPRLGVNPVELGSPLPQPRSPLVSRWVSFAARTPAGDALGARRIARRALEQEVDLVVTLGDNLTPDVVDTLRRSGIEVVLWHPDAISNWGRMWFALANYSLICFKDPVAVSRLRSMQGLRVHYLPEACNPRTHRPTSVSGRSGTLVVAGNSYATRVRLLERLSNDGVPLDLYGSNYAPWLPRRDFMNQHHGRQIYMGEKARVFRGASAVLNNLHPAEGGLNCRLFEAAGCGAAVLTEYRPALDDLFTCGEEVAAFRDYSELLHLAHQLLDDPEMATRLGDAAWKRAHSDHSYEQRLRQVMEIVL